MLETLTDSEGTLWEIDQKELTDPEETWYYLRRAVDRPEWAARISSITLKLTTRESIHVAIIEWFLETVSKKI